MSYPNIIKSQTVWGLWPAQDFGSRGDKYITKSESCLFLQGACLLVLICASTNIIKIFCTINKLLGAQEFCFKIYSGAITRQKEQSKIGPSCM